MRAFIEGSIQLRDDSKKIPKGFKKHKLLGDVKFTFRCKLNKDGEVKIEGDHILNRSKVPSADTLVEAMQEAFVDNFPLWELYANIEEVA